MLQLSDLNARAIDNLTRAGSFDSTATDESTLEARANIAILRLREERAREAKIAAAHVRLDEAFDRALRTDAVEYLDRPDFPEKKKLGMARAIHAMNVATLSYRRFLRFLTPELIAVRARHGRAPRVLEIASGVGGFALALATLAKERGIDVEVTGSDIVPLYVTTARATAAKRGIPVRFERIDALDMSAIDPGAYDIVFVAQSAHHFSAGQLASMIRESRRIATSSFVSVDGWRSAHMLAFVGGTSILSMHPALIHDSWVTARKFYSEPELRFIASMGAPDARVSTHRLWPINSVLRVGFADGAP